MVSYLGREKKIPAATNALNTGWDAPILYKSKLNETIINCLLSLGLPDRKETLACCNTHGSTSVGSGLWPPPPAMSPLEEPWRLTWVCEMGVTGCPALFLPFLPPVLPHEDPVLGSKGHSHKPWAHPLASHLCDASGGAFHHLIPSIWKPPQAETTC